MTAHSYYSNERPVNEIAIDEGVLSAFDAAIEPYEPAVDLVTVNGQQGLSEAMKSFVDELSKLNIDRVSRKFNWFQRLTGADLVAQIEFDIAAYGLSAQMTDLGGAAARARQTLTLLISELPKLTSLRQKHEELLAEASPLLKGKDPGDYNVGRFQRRLANLEALIASDRMTEAQMALSIDALGTALDRHSEIEKLLFPVWQQHAFAIAQSNGALNQDTDLIGKFTQAHQNLTTKLVF